MKLINTNEFCQKAYGQKLYKLSFDAGFSCPNRDQSDSSGGCIFCSAGGSGDFAIPIKDLVHTPCPDEYLKSTIKKAGEKVAKKFSGDKYIAYFQAYTNTYVPAKVLQEQHTDLKDYLRNIYLPVIKQDDIAVLSIATRPDCLSEPVYELLAQLNEIKPVWVELGFQTSNPKTAQYIRRGYENQVYREAVKRLNSIGIHTITHVILYLPGESIEDMKNTVQYVVDSGSCGIKLQLLHILKNTALADEYELFLNQQSKVSFHIPTLEEYAKTLKECLELLPPQTVVHRLTGDPPKRLLIEPQWTADKKKVLNTISDTLNPTGPYYVYIVKCADGSLYTGSTNDVDKRFAKHASGRGSKYTKAHTAVEVVYREECVNKRAALKREYEIKQLSRAQKLELISKNFQNNS